MEKYIKQLFINNIKLEEEILSPSLYISFDKYSALRGDYKIVLNEIKKYNNINIIKSDIRALQEGYEQGLFILDLDWELLFLRLILSYKLIYDSLIYTIDNIDLINKIFFSKEEIKINDKFLNFLNSDKSVVILNDENQKYRILKANKAFYNKIKYEDWDYANKYQNVLNQKMINTDLNHLELYQSDNNIIKFEFDIYTDSNIIALVEK